MRISYNFYNLSAACSVGDFFGVSIDNCKSAIESYIPTNNRSQIQRSEKGNTLILDAYNANPSSMLVAIQSFEKIKAKKKIAILGDMLELGDDSLKEHQLITEELVKRNFHLVLLVGNEFKQTKNNFLYFENTNQIKNWIQNNPIQNSTVLLKGSRGIRLESLIEFL